MWCHDLLAVKYGMDDGSLSNIDRRRDLEEHARTAELPRIREWIDALEELLGSIDRNVNPPLSLHDALLRIAGHPGETRRWGN